MAALSQLKDTAGRQTDRHGQAHKCSSLKLKCKEYLQMKKIRIQKTITLPVALYWC
jgi:hypothetical protein